MSTKLLPAAALSTTLLASTAIADAPGVAVDIAPLHSLVAQVMDGVGSPDLLIAPGGSPHEYALSPSEAGALQGADVVFWLGEDLTPWLEGAIETLADGASVTALLEIDETTLLDFREDALFEDHHDHGHDDEGHDDHDEEAHGHDDHDDHDDHKDDEHAEDDHGHDDHDDHKDDDHDHAEDAHGHKDDDHDDHDDHAHDEHGDDDHDDHDDHAGHGHGAHDPHAWLSPDNAIAWLDVIAAKLSAADPDNAGTYFANAAAAKAEVEAMKAEVSELLAPAQGVSFVVFHDAYQYFETAFDFPASGAIALGDAADPSPARIAEIQGRVRDEGIDCVLAEPQYNPGLVAVVLDGTDAKTGVIDPLGASLEPGPDMYGQLIRNMAQTLAECL